jgi:hypothetical protein
VRLALVIAVGVALLGAASARADIGVLGSVPQSAAPGDRATVDIGCGGCPAQGLAMPVALVPAGHTGARPCRATSCARRSTAPPAGAPYVPIGVARPGHPRDVSTLAFTVPDAEPGRYAYVVWCAPCLPGRAGSLIGGPSALHPAANAPSPHDYRGYLRIEPGERDPFESLFGWLRALLAFSPS